MTSYNRSTTEADYNTTPDFELTIVFDFDDDGGNTTTDTRVFYGYSVVVPLAILMILFMIFAIAGNVMVIMTIVRHRGMRTRTNMFIVNLAVADILVAVLDMPVSLTTILEGDWVFGKFLCQLNGFTMALFLICSIHTLMYISIHKYFSITKPFSRAMTVKRIKIMIGATWVWATICAMGPLLGWNSIVFKRGASQCGPDIPRDTRAKLHSLFITASNYLIPLMVMSFCYFRIFKEIRLHMSRIRETSNINLASSVKQQKKVSVTLFLVLLCFFLCWTPFVLYSTAVSFMKDKKRMPDIINPLAYWCGYLNSACNPIIYAFRSPSFRKGYREIICGQPASGLDAENSFSFRSKSNRGSLKQNSENVVAGSSSKTTEPDPAAAGRPKRLLSQTSWVSLPIIPFLVRSFSSVKNNDARANVDDNDSDIDICQSCFCLECRRKGAKRTLSARYWKNSMSDHSVRRQDSEPDERSGCNPPPDYASDDTTGGMHDASGAVLGRKDDDDDEAVRKPLSRQSAIAASDDENDIVTIDEYRVERFDLKRNAESFEKL